MSLSTAINKSIGKVNKDLLKAKYGLSALSQEERAEELMKAAGFGRDSASLLENGVQALYHYMKPTLISFTKSSLAANDDQNVNSSHKKSKDNSSSVIDEWLKSNQVTQADPILKTTSENSSYRSIYELDNVLAQNNEQVQETKKTKKEEVSQIEEMKIKEEDIHYGEYGEGNGYGSHGGDPEGNTSAGGDTRDYGKDRWLANGAKEYAAGERSLNDESRFRTDLSDEKQVYRDGQGIAQIKDEGNSGLDSQNWFKLQTIQGDQFISLAKSDNSDKSAGQLLGERAKEYVQAGIKDGDLIGILIGKGMSAEDYKNSPEEQARYDRFLKAKSGNYNWDSMEKELNIGAEDMRALEAISGIDRNDQNLFTENLYYESFNNLDKLGKDILHFKDTAQAFNVIWACNVKQDHNGALHMNHGSVTGLASNDQRPTLVLSAKNDLDMQRQLFRLMYVPEDASKVNGLEYLNRDLNKEEQNAINALADSNISVAKRIDNFNKFLDDEGLVKNIGVGSYMLKGHGWSGGIAMHDSGTYDNSDKATMALMGMAVSANVDQARVHQQSCSTAQGGDSSNVAVGNNTMNDFVASTTDIVSVGATEIHWNGQGRHYQYVKSIHGSFVDEGQITAKIYYQRNGLRGKENLRKEEIASMKMWTKNADGIVVKRQNQETQSEPGGTRFSFGDLAGGTELKEDKEEEKNSKMQFSFA